MKATNIKWDIDIEEVNEKLDNMTVEKCAKALEVPETIYANMSTEERHDYAYDVFRHSPSSLEDFVGLSDEIEIPNEIISEYNGDDVFVDGEGTNDEFSKYISEWLSDEFYCHKGFSLTE